MQTANTKSPPSSRRRRNTLLPKAEPRNVVVSIRVTYNEFKALCADAKKQGVVVSELAHTRTVNGKAGAK
jgi:hypothetical protein